MKVNWKKVLKWILLVILACFLIYNLIYYQTDLITGENPLSDVVLAEIKDSIDEIGDGEFVVMNLENKVYKYIFNETNYYLDIDIEYLDDVAIPEKIDENIRNIIKYLKDGNYEIDRMSINYFSPSDSNRDILTSYFKFGEYRDLLTEENLDFKENSNEYYDYSPSTRLVIENKEYYDWMSLSSHDYLNELLAVEYFSYDDEDKSEIAHLFVESEEDLYLKLKEAFKELVNYDIINQKPLISEFTIDAQIFEDMSKAPKFDPLDTARSGSNPFEKARAARVEEDIRTLHIVTEELYNIDWNEVTNYEELKALVDSWNV